MNSTEEKNRTGLILAAGFGSRLKGTVENTDLKPLTPVAGRPLIFRVIDSLEKAGCSRILIVLGHGYEEIKSDIEESYDGDHELVYIYNEQYHLKNGVSLLAAREYLQGEFVMTMADHIVADSIMEKAKSHTPPEKGATLLVDYKIDTIFDMDDATKVRAEGNRLRSIGKQIDEYNCIDTGVFVCSTGLLEVMQEIYRSEGDVSISDGVQRLAKNGKMQVLDVEDGYWQDVDTPEMMEYAEKMLLQGEIAS